MRHAARIAFTLAAFALPTAAFAQPVVVVNKPGDGQWTVSYTRMFEKGDAATGTELSTYCKTLAAARQEAARLQAWSRSMDANTDYRLKKIFIEGEDAAAGPPNDSAPKTPTLVESIGSSAKKLKEAKKDVDEALWTAKLIADPKAALEEKVEKYEKKAKERGLGSTIKEYGENVADAYKRAKDLKDGMLKLDAKVMDKSFKTVNDAIDKYNKEVDNGAKLYGPQGNPLPKLKAVGPDTAKAADEWKAAQKKQFDLEGRKETLDKKKADLDRERDKLADEWKVLSAKGEPDASDPKVVRLRERLSEYKADSDKYAKSVETYSKEAEPLRMAAENLSGRSGPSSNLDDAAAKLVGTKWRSTDDDGRYTNYEFRYEDGKYRWSSKWYFKDGGQVSSNGSWGAFKVAKTDSGLVVSLTDESSKPPYDLDYLLEDGQLRSTKYGTVLKPR